MRLTKWSGTRPGTIIFVRPGSMSGIGYLYETHSWGYIKRYVNTQHRRNGYYECIDTDIRLNEKTFYI